MIKKKTHIKSILQGFFGLTLSFYFAFISVLFSLTTIPSHSLNSNESLGTYLQSLIELSELLQDFETTAEEHGIELNFENDIDLFHSDYAALVIEHIKFSTLDFKHHFKNSVLEKIALEVNTPPPDFSKS